MGRFDDAREGRVALHVRGEPWASWPAPRTVLGEPGKRMPLRSESRGANDGGERMELEFHDDATGLTAVNHVQFFGENPISRRWVTVRNDSDRAFTLDVLHSAFIDGMPWTRPGQFRVHVPYNHNYSEGQWRANALEALGLTRTFKSNVAHWIVSATGRSSMVCLPTAILEDTVNGWSLIWQIEHPGSWMWDLGQGTGDVLTLGVGGLTETHGHWWKTLAPGAEIDSLPVAVGRVEGDAQRAVAAMTEYRRLACKPAHPVDDGLPVIFNDYMNCLNGDPNEEKSLRLIGPAAEAGSEVYVMDAGWFGPVGWRDVGDWRESPGKFPRGLRHVMDAVRGAGMIPGLWVEIEAAARHVELAKKPDSWFMCMHGARNVFGTRYALDFRNADVVRFADETMDRLIGDYGLGYIKFDYNFSVLLGTDRDADSPGQGALEHMRAVLEWYRRLRARHPRVILENCASGGMRNDYGMLSVLQLCSSSDQTRYDYYPAIAAGCMGAILPEQLAIWSYPLKGESDAAAVFNMVNALLGRIHLSGGIADWNASQRGIVREAIALYKSAIRADIPRSVPFWPLGWPSIEKRDGFVSVGLLNAPARRAWLAVWRLESPAAETALPIPFAGPGLTVRQAFPSAPCHKVSCGGGQLRVTLPEPLNAAVLQLRW